MSSEPQLTEEEARRVARNIRRKLHKWLGISRQERFLFSSFSEGEGEVSIIATDRRIILASGDMEQFVIGGVLPTYRSVPYRSITYWTLTPKRESEFATLYFSTNIIVDSSPMGFNLNFAQEEAARNVAETIATSLPQVVDAPPEDLD